MRILLIAMLFILFIPAMAATKWVGMPVPGAIIYVHPGQTDLARQTAGLINEELPRVADTLGVASAGPFPVYVFTSRIEFLTMTEPDIALQGVSFSPSGAIYVDASGQDGLSRTTLTHELTHSVINQLLGDNLARLPSWMNEGIAGHISDPVTPAQLPQVSQLIHRDGVLTIDEMEAAFHKGPYRAAAYLQSRSMMAWLEYHHPGAVKSILHDIASGAAFPASVQRETGLSPESWWQQWRQSIPTYMYWFTFLNSAVLYAPLAFIIAIIAIIRIWQRKRAAVEEVAEDEDGDEAVERQP
ncbi:MAG: peptidase MA family metallohydrolase [Armatimonadota bacterium]